LIFEQPIKFGELICVIMQNSIKIGQIVFEISQFFDFQDGCHPPSWIFIFLKFGHPLGWDG